jgi:hypothetical protein
MKMSIHGATVCLDNVAVLIVHTDSESEAVAQREEMATGSAADINQARSFRH